MGTVKQWIQATETDGCDCCISLLTQIPGAEEADGFVVLLKLIDTLNGHSQRNMGVLCSK